MDGPPRFFSVIPAASGVDLFHYKLLAATDVDAFLKFVGIHAYTLEVVYRSVAVVGCID